MEDNYQKCETSNEYDDHSRQVAHIYSSGVITQKNILGLTHKRRGSMAT